MRIRDVVLQNRFAVLDAGTWTFNVNLVDPVTEFKIWFYVKNNAVGPNNINRPIYLVTEVAVIDGSEVIYSMDGACAIALSAYNQGQMPLYWHSDNPGSSQYFCIPIEFGRHLEDQEYIFDPTRFRNPQIRITWNIARLGAVGANAFATGTAQISVWAKVMEEGATPRGYLMSKEIKEFASLAGGDEITYLPTDFPMRKVMLRAYAHGGMMTTAVTNIKISQDEDKFIPIDIDSADFIFLMHNWFPEFALHGRGNADDNEFREHFLGEYAHGKVCGGEGDHILGASGFANDGYTLHCVTNAGAGQTDCPHFWNAWSRTPLDTWCYPFGDQMDPDDWFQTMRVGNLRLMLTQGGLGYTEQVVTQQAHPY